MLTIDRRDARAAPYNLLYIPTTSKSASYSTRNLTLCTYIFIQAIFKKVLVLLSY